MKRIFIITLLLMLQNAFANKLVIVQALSKTKKSFITRIGKKDGVQPGSKGTFTSKNFSLIAKATSVTREFAQWTIENPKADVPFEKGEIVTYNNSTENIWKLVSEDERKKIIKERIFQPRDAFIAKTAISRGMFESVSGADAQDYERGGPLFEFYYDKELTKHFSVGAGLRFDSERLNAETATEDVTRFMGALTVTYYSYKIKSFYNGRAFASLSMGYGVTNHVQQDSNFSTSGPVYLLPGFTIGLAMPIGKAYDMIFDTALESLNSTVGLPTGGEQTYADVNARIGIGIKWYMR